MNRSTCLQMTSETDRACLLLPFINGVFLLSIIPLATSALENCTGEKPYGYIHHQKFLGEKKEKKKEKQSKDI